MCFGALWFSIINHILVHSGSVIGFLRQAVKNTKLQSVLRKSIRIIQVGREHPVNWLEISNPRSSLFNKIAESNHFRDLMTSQRSTVVTVD